MAMSQSPLQFPKMSTHVRRHSKQRVWKWHSSSVCHLDARSCPMTPCCFFQPSLKKVNHRHLQVVVGKRKLLLHSNGMREIQRPAICFFLSMPGVCLLLVGCRSHRIWDAVFKQTDKAREVTLDWLTHRNGRIRTQKLSLLGKRHAYYIPYAVSMSLCSVPWVLLELLSGERCSPMARIWNMLHKELYVMTHTHTSPKA